jgi:hypothetical protein
MKLSFNKTGMIFLTLLALTFSAGGVTLAHAGWAFDNKTTTPRLADNDMNEVVISDSTVDADRYGQLPLSFVPNAGQSDAAVHYQAQGMGGTLFFEDDTVTLSLPETHVYLRFEGVNAARRVVNAEKLPGTVNYFIGNQPSNWHTDLPTYAGIVYEQLYPGIDLHYDGSQKMLKGTYTVAPHANPSNIRWRYEGVTSTRVDEQTGDLLLTLDDGSTLTEKAPSAWQTSAGTRVSVPVKYALMEDDSIGFALGDYEPNAPLTIDPLLIYSTFLGGNGFDGAKSVAVDSAGNAYITGETRSTNFPTQNAISNTLNGGSDAFVVKINATGTALVYATYLGGSDYEDEFGPELAGGIAVDSNGYAYVTGCTNSADFPTVNPIQVTHGANANCDVFVSKLNPAGSALIYSTFLGGSGADAANAIAVDDQGSAYIVGEAGKDFPGSSFTSSAHVFVTKINPAGSAIVFSWFFGGDSYEYATDVAVDSTHAIYVVGNTYSTNFPVVNAAQPTIGGGTSSHHDAFVTKIAADGASLIYSTYLGGSETDEASGIALDDLGNAYITGVTESNLDFPVLNAYQPTYGGGQSDAFVTKLNAAGNTFVYSTYLGGNDDENYLNGHGPYGGIAVDSKYNAYVTGYTCSANFPVLDSFRNGDGSTSFAFVTRFNAAGNALVFSTLIGAQGVSSGDTSGTGIALDTQGNVYVVGETNADDFLTLNPLQPHDGGTDAFITKLARNMDKTLVSIGANDGWILESAENSNVGGTMNSTSTTFRLGDDAAKKQYLGILSFDTSSLLDNAVITKVTLKVRKQGITGGGNPVTMFKGFMVDIKKGFFGTAALQTTDFQTTANKTYGPFMTAFSGGWYSINLTSGKAYINKLNTLSGLTQIRLRFCLDDNNNAVANFISFFSGNSATNKPMLIIQYYEP